MSIEVPAGMVDGRQRIDFELNKKEELLGKLIPVLYDWKKKHDTKNLLILPDIIMREAGRHILDGYAECTYQFKIGENEYAPCEATLPQPG